MDDSKPEVTELLRAWNEGDLEARDRAVALMYGELRRRAAAHLCREHPDTPYSRPRSCTGAYIVSSISATLSGRVGHTFWPWYRR